jgi:glycosyltransferase involved in cell wall biosynthesis
LMPVYRKDNPSVFNEALKSILENTVTPCQIVIVADGPLSADLDSVISNYENQPSILVKRLPENRGIIEALNFGLDFCDNSLIARCDADDINIKTRFACQLEAFHHNPNLVLCGGQIVERSDEIVLKKFVPLNHDEIIESAKLRNPFNHMTVMFRKDAVIECGRYPYFPYREDYALWVSLLQSGCKTRNLKDTLVVASGGLEMYKRRGNIRHLKHELSLQKYFLELGFINRFQFFINIIIRGANMLLPANFRRVIYQYFLRYG